MVEYKSFSPDVEIIGDSILSVMEGMGAFKKTAYQILENNGIKDPAPQKWFNFQNYLNAFKEIAEKLGNATLKVVGMKLSKNAVFPPELDIIEKVLTVMDQAYHMHYKNGEIGHYSFECNGNNKGIMTCNNPYPCAYNIGIIEGLMYKLSKEGQLPTVKHIPGDCRMDGAKHCCYELSW